MTSQLADRIRNRMFPGVPVPFDAAGEIDEGLHQAYIAWMARQAVGGVAVWAHTGRGMKLVSDQRDRVLQAWRSGIDTKTVVCGVGVPDDTRLPTSAGPRTEAVLRAATDVAEQAVRGGADAALAHPPRALAHLSDLHDRVVQYHAAICSVGIPVLAFYLYEEAGGVAYAPELLERILGLSGVIGLKVATLDSVMTYQDVIALVQRIPGALVVTGEDRFLGYSLTAGAEAALIGMGSALSDRCSELLEARVACDWERFFRLSSALDNFARATFVNPMEGYVQRMLWALEADEVISRPAYDPWSPPLALGERDRVFAAARNLRSL